MPGPAIQVTFTSEPYHTSLRGADERVCCIQAENVIRAWVRQGHHIVVDVRCDDAALRRRVVGYLNDVIADVLAEPLLEHVEPLAPGRDF